ncbi:MAG: hypothetical protein Q9168_008172, partial [Polycauliona sp. 1 TL-2023]
NDIETFRAGEHTNDTDYLTRIHTQLLYRTWMSELANKYKKSLNFHKLPLIEDWNQQAPGRPASISLAKENIPLVRSAQLFQRPDGEKGYWGEIWPKPILYLAYGLAAAGYGPEELPGILEIVGRIQDSFMDLKMAEYAESQDTTVV